MSDSNFHGLMGLYAWDDGDADGQPHEAEAQEPAERRHEEGVAVADDILDANKHRYVPLTWSRPDGTPVKYVKRAPCSGAWVDELVIAPDRRSHSIERLPGPFVARWTRDVPILTVADDVQTWRRVRAGEVAAEADMRSFLASCRESIARFRATPGEYVGTRGAK